MAGLKLYTQAQVYYLEENRQLSEFSG